VRWGPSCCLVLAPESVWGRWKYPREKGNPGALLSTWAVDGALAMTRSGRVEAYGLTTGDPLEMT